MSTKIRYKGAEYDICQKPSGALFIYPNGVEINIRGSQISQEDKALNPHAFWKKSGQWVIREKFVTTGNFIECETKERIQPPKERARVGDRELRGLGILPTPVPVPVPKPKQPKVSLKSDSRILELEAELSREREAKERLSNEMKQRLDAITNELTTCQALIEGDDAQEQVMRLIGLLGECQTENAKLKPVEEEEPVIGSFKGVQESVRPQSENELIRQLRARDEAVTLEQKQEEDKNENGEVDVEKDVLPIGTKIGAFVVIPTGTTKSYLGKGSFGTVYKVKNSIDNKEYALKLVSVTGVSGLSATIIQEATILKSLRHPNLVPAKYIVDEKGSIGMVMPLGISMYDWLKTRPDPHQILQTAFNIWCGLQHLWLNDIAHLDLKLDNVLMFDESREKVAKLTDFGISQRAQRDGMYYQVLGTPFFMAPELFLAQQETRKSVPFSVIQDIDRWALGCLYFSLFFGGRNLLDNAQEILVPLYLERDGITEDRFQNDWLLRSKLILNCIIYVIGPPPVGYEFADSSLIKNYIRGPSNTNFYDVTFGNERDAYAYFIKFYGTTGMVAIEKLITSLLKWKPQDRRPIFDDFYNVPLFGFQQEPVCTITKQLLNVNDQVFKPSNGKEKLLGTDLGIPLWVVNMTNEIWARWLTCNTENPEESLNNPWQKLAAISIAAKLFEAEIKRSIKYDKVAPPLSPSTQTALDSLRDWSTLMDHQKEIVIQWEEAILRTIDWQPDTVEFSCPPRDIVQMNRDVSQILRSTKSRR